MFIRKFTADPINQSGFGLDDLNVKLGKAIHVETFTKDEGRFGGEQTLVIFAFYNDEDYSVEK